MRAIVVGWAVVAAGLAALWAIGRRRGNMAVVDVGWTVAVGGLGVGFAAVGDAPPARRLLVGAMAAAWSARLALHLLFDRIVGHAEEGRYQTLRARWAPRADRAFFIFFQAQGVAALALAAPFWLAARNPAPSLSPLEWAAPLLLAVAVLGEGTADRQLRRWKADPQNRGRTLRAGLWRYSRHPNYFFEWLVWCAFALVAAPAPWGMAALACPAVMLLLLFRVTGIPATEAQALRSRGDDYRRYQQTTSVFVPWVPRKEAT